MMFCIKHLMRLHPEYNEMIMPFYSKLYEKYPYNEENPFHFEQEELDEIINGRGEVEAINKSLDEMVWDLGLTLPSWEDDNGENQDEEDASS